MKLQILSDLHNEFLRKGKINQTHQWTGTILDTAADVIIMAGDIDTGTNGAQWLLTEAQRLNKQIIYVLGNHEFYRQEYTSLKKQIAILCKYTQVHFLDCASFEKNGVRILGLTLWTDYRARQTISQDLAMFYAEKGLVDHSLIQYDTGSGQRTFTPKDALTIHHDERTWLAAELKKPFAGKTVVVTHHGPHPICDHPDFPNSEIASAFYSDLTDIIEEHDIHLWVYGHSHSNVDQTIHGTRIVSNQAGYPGENVSGFNPKNIIEVI
jgi:predicted phosphodiesterase